MPSHRLVVGVVLAVLIGLSSGCGKRGPAPPKTYAASGTVKYKDGSPVKGGLVEFRSTTDPSLTTTGEIDQQGKFVLKTLFGESRLDGAQEGPHTVTVNFLIGTDQSQEPSVVLAAPLTVKSDGVNDFVIVVDRQPKR